MEIWECFGIIGDIDFYNAFDLLCWIKIGKQKIFWSVLERYFNSKYVIFEFKNYNGVVLQKEIYTIENICVQRRYIV